MVAVAAGECASSAIPVCSHAWPSWCIAAPQALEQLVHPWPKPLQDEAEPFIEATPNDVLRRILLGILGRDTDKSIEDLYENHPGVRFTA